MKKRLLITGLVFISLLFLTSCGIFGSKSKEFTGGGISVTLTSDFKEQEQMIADFHLQALKYGFMSNRESKSFLAEYGIRNHQQYTKEVLKNVQETDGIISEFTNDDITFNYAKYFASVDEKDFGYLLITIEGLDHFYTINFFSLEKDFDKYYEQFMTWAKTIKVDVETTTA